MGWSAWVLCSCQELSPEEAKPSTLTPPPPFFPFLFLPFITEPQSTRVSPQGAESLSCHLASSAHLHFTLDD